MKENCRLRNLNCILVLFAFIAMTSGAFAETAGVDGLINPGEYPASASFAGGDFKVNWRFEGDRIRFGIEAISDGWVYLGLDPRSAMDQADMIFGLVPENAVPGSVPAVDAFSDGSFGPHPEDTAVGGGNDILAAAGSRTGNRVVFEFERKLNTSDARDKQIPATRNLPIIWAVGPDLNFESKHTRAGSGILDMAAGTGGRARVARVPILIGHIFLMSLSFLAMSAGIVIARYYKTRKFWLKAHKPLGVIAALSGICGVLTSAAMVQLSGGPHFRVLHAAAGLSGILLCTAMPALGFGIFKYRGDKKKIKKLHRIAGRITILAMALIILSGLETAGIV